MTTQSICLKKHGQQPSFATLRRHVHHFAATVALCCVSHLCAASQTLVGRAVLPAQTFADGPTSGTLIGGPTVNGITTPFVNQQPVQGFSAILDENDGTYRMMCDNGYGSIENSAAFNLRVYHVQPS
ncbi:MAG: hypothetical protein SGJ11_02570 [Phycisphaerae bacterium]|nr:hypothetical protein [Phycisphaerae bacterium]